MKKLIPVDAVLVPETAEKVFSGKIFDVYQWPQKLFDGSEYTFEMLKRTDTVSVICLVQDNGILVVDDEQPHLGTKRGFPGGRVDVTDQSTEAAAKREILEETGYSFDNWRLIQVRQPYRKIEWFVYVFLAWSVSGQTEPDLDAGERINLSTLSFEELKTQVMNDDVDYLGESRDIFRNLNGIEGLLGMPEYEGREVDR